LAAVSVPEGRALPNSILRSNMREGDELLGEWRAGDDVGCLDGGEIYPEVGEGQIFTYCPVLSIIRIDQFFTIDLDAIASLW
jgi:hypothetical protein